MNSLIIISTAGGCQFQNTHSNTGSVPKYSAESENNLACTAGMALAHFRILNNELVNKDTYVIPEQATLILLDSKSAVCASKNSKYIKHTRHISRRVHFVGNGEEWNLKKTVWCDGGLQLSNIGNRKLKGGWIESYIIIYYSNTLELTEQLHNRGDRLQKSLGNKMF